MWDVTVAWRPADGMLIFLLTHPVWDVTLVPSTAQFHDEFLLTHPVWDVTVSVLQDKKAKQISTHTSRVGCDAQRGSRVFQESISTHTSRVGCDDISRIENNIYIGFLLTHPVWDVTVSGSSIIVCILISTHTSRVGCDQCSC